MRRLIGVLAFSLTTFGASAAFAQAAGMGQSGTVAFGAERLFAFYKGSIHYEDASDNEADWDQSGLGFGWGANAYPFNVPRLGFDYFITDQLSIGGALGYAEFDGDDDNNFDADTEAFILAPRVGYFIGFNETFAFWPRGGLTYHSLDPEGDRNSQSGLALTLEAMFTISPAPHFAFLAGPTFDMDFMGSSECRFQNRDEDCKLRYRSFGLQVGLLGYF
ncbi:MAG: hypothetical protein L6Q84_15760 [Polyangiaceae bacterium]|nr:hypothetical protein [Polyangiaceae bacterium]